MHLGFSQQRTWRIDAVVDGDVRRGTDLIKAIALGGKAALIGRPILWGLVADGENGVTRVLELLRQELDLAMALCGCANLADIGKREIRGHNTQCFLNANKNVLCPQIS